MYKNNHDHENTSFGESALKLFLDLKKNDLDQEFNNLLEAIKAHHDFFAMRSLNLHPSFITRKNSEGMTPLMFAAKEGCSIPLFSFLLDKYKPYWTDRDSNILIPILIEQRREAFFKLLEPFLAKHEETSNQDYLTSY